MGWLNVKITAKGALGMTRRKWAQEILKPAMHSLGMHWRENLMPKRFDARQRVYGFRDRTQKYIRAKRNPRSGAADKGLYKLVFSGDSRDRARSGKITARATTNKQSVKIAGPQKLNFRPMTKGNRAPINMLEEFRATTGRDVRSLQIALRRAIKERFVAVGSKTTFTATVTI